MKGVEERRWRGGKGKGKGMGEGKEEGNSREINTRRWGRRGRRRRRRM